ncbi:MAG: circularly permuted type 2 ATP-grasp protein, partial [Propionivibrio sp.]
ALGVPGLLQAVRAGKVMIANALGSGLLQSAALPGFLPGACEKLLGEKLAMPSVGTWWCGEAAALEFTLHHLDRLVIKGAFPSQRMNPVFGNALEGAARDELIARLRARPQAYVAQELVEFSQAPAWSTEHDRRLQPRGVGLRVYAAATADGYSVMPGGLTRVSAITDARFISMQRGGSSKDTWVLSDGEVNTFSLLKHLTRKEDLIRSGSNLSSRVVENLYWFGRYAERCDDTARLLRVGLSRLVEAGAEQMPAIMSAVDLCRSLKLLPEEAAQAKITKKTPARGSDQRARFADPQTHLLAALGDADREDGLAGDIRRLLWVGTQVRERFSLDNWHALNHLQLQLQRYSDAEPELSDALAFLDQVLLASSTLAGFAMDNMTRDDGWRFLIIGRRIERLIFLANAIAQFLRLESTRATGSLEWLLELADSIITYRSRYMTQPELLPALDLIVFDQANPHAVAFQLQNLVRYVGRLARELGDANGALSDHALRPLLARLLAFDDQRFETLDFAQCRACDPCAELADLLDEVAMTAASLSDRLAMRYFTHVGDVGRQTLAA